MSKTIVVAGLGPGGVVVGGADGPAFEKATVGYASYANLNTSYNSGLTAGRFRFKLSDCQSIFDYGPT